MRRAAASLALGLALGLAPASARSADFPESIELEGQTLHRAATTDFRVLRLISIFSVALYLEADEQPSFPFDPERSVCLLLRYHRNIDRDRFIEAAKQALEYQFPTSEIALWQFQIDRLNEAYRSVAPGDTYALRYQPGSGTTLYFNGEPAANVPGHAFALFYFSIWLGDHPQARPLRRDLLGRSS